MMFCPYCENPVTYEDKAARKCPHCGKDPSGRDQHSKTVPTVNVVVPDHARGAGRGDNGNGSGAASRPESYPVPERKTEGDQCGFKIGDTVNVSIEFAAGKFEGPAKVVTTHPLQIQFTIGPKRKQICIGSGDVCQP
jgi:endogenous inhibitor of DNA gyrase (YacG/DUF329 family)